MTKSDFTILYVVLSFVLNILNFNLWIRKLISLSLSLHKEGSGVWLFISERVLKCIPSLRWQYWGYPLLFLRLLGCLLWKLPALFPARGGLGDVGGGFWGTLCHEPFAHFIAQLAHGMYLQQAGLSRKCILNKGHRDLFDTIKSDFAFSD